MASMISIGGLKHHVSRIEPDGDQFRVRWYLGIIQVRTSIYPTACEAVQAACQHPKGLSTTNYKIKRPELVRIELGQETFWVVECSSGARPFQTESEAQTFLAEMSPRRSRKVPHM